jgi:hypothetical protein
MHHGNEFPLAVAFTDGCGDFVFEELVFENDVFWGTVYLNYYPRHCFTTAQLTLRNNLLIESVLEEHLPFLLSEIRVLIASLLHHHY